MIELGNNNKGYSGSLSTFLDEVWAISSQDKMSEMVLSPGILHECSFYDEAVACRYQKPKAG